MSDLEFVTIRNSSTVIVNKIKSFRCSGIGE